MRRGSTHLQAALKVECDGARVQALRLGDQLCAQRAPVHDVRAAGAVREQAASRHVEQAGAARGASGLVAARRRRAGCLQRLQRPEPSSYQGRGGAWHVLGRTGYDGGRRELAVLNFILGPRRGVAGLRLPRSARAGPWLQQLCDSWLQVMQQTDHGMYRALQSHDYICCLRDQGVWGDQAQQRESSYKRQARTTAVCCI